MKLYEITAEYLRLLEGIRQEAEENGEVSTEVAAAITEAEGSFQEKGAAVAAYILNLASERAAIMAAVKRMSKRIDALDPVIARLEEYLLDQLERTGLSISTAEFTVKSVKNPPRVDVADSALIPPQFVETKLESRIMLREIGAAMKSGIDVPGARLVQTSRLVLR